MKECTEERFLKDIENHEMKIMQDDGTYRHIIFNRPDSWDHRFELITWPGYLAYVGDMGDYTFQRCLDMFKFFRVEREHNSNRKIFINPYYWSEKCIAVDKSDGIKKYSPELFRETIKEWADETAESYMDEDQKTEFFQAVKDDILCHGNGTECEARQAVDNFGFDCDGWKESISDFWEHDLTDYTFRFVWCCYAIAWGIEQYDKYKADGK